MIKELPIYEALIKDEADGIYAISLVDLPAIESDFVAFKKNDNEEIKLAVLNEEQRLLMGPVMRPDYPIYRRNGDYEYYIVYSKETIKQMAEKLMADGTFNNIDLQHNGEYLPKGSVKLQQLFVKDIEKGISPLQFADTEDGTLFAVYKVYDDDIWAMAKDNQLNGFSLAGYFSVEKLIENKQIKKENKMNKFKEMLKQLLAQFNTVGTDKGELTWDGDEDLKAGDAVYIDEKPAEDGEYKTEDNKIIVVKEGVVVAIEDPDAEVAPSEGEELAEDEVIVEEPVEEKPVEPSENDVLKGEIENLKGEIEQLKGEIEEIKNILAKPVVAPIEEEFSATKPTEVDKWERVAAALKH